MFGSELMKFIMKKREQRVKKNESIVVNIYIYYIKKEAAAKAVSLQKIKETALSLTHLIVSITHCTL